MFSDYPKFFTDEELNFDVDMENASSTIKNPNSVQREIAILPIQNTILFPGVILPIALNREKSLKLVSDIYKTEKYVGVVGQKENNLEDPTAMDLLLCGTVAKILKRIKLPNGSTTLIIQGMKRFQIEEMIQEQPFFKARIKTLKDVGEIDTDHFKALIASLKDLALRIVLLSSSATAEATEFLRNIDNPVFLIHFIAGNMGQDLVEKQKILETDSIPERASLLLSALQKELNFAELKNKVANKTKVELDKQQKEYFLQQQLKSIREELGSGDGQEEDIREMKQRAEQKKWPVAVRELFEKELKKLETMPAARPEYSIEYAHLELLLDLPWDECSTDIYDIAKAKKILDKEHFGMQKAKSRIIEYIAVLALKQDMKAPILCFVGPPGIGKTSLAKSIANTLGRKFIKISLGGTHDESEIRGHRKTYIGAMPGRIIQSLKKAKVSNPVILLDEIDKVGKDFRSDVSSALLEVLDPEQNNCFYDNYLEVEYDLSKVLFIATANDVQIMQAPLRDRLEIIELSGYVLEEKVKIAEKHLLPKQIQANGLDNLSIRITDTALKMLIASYTQESGVRELERSIAKILRSVARTYVTDKKKPKPISEKEVLAILGKVKYPKDRYSIPPTAGVAVGLAWTPVGGDILFIEVLVRQEEKEELQLTGNLGNVMKESAIIALSFLKANSTKYGIKLADITKKGIHIHVPEGAIPKDGPSAGITLLTALTSAITGRRVKNYLAMTGEITLRGEVLPVGGIKEKILAAKRAGMKTIIMAKRNEKDVAEIEPAYVKGLKFHYVSRMEEVLHLALDKKK